MLSTFTTVGSIGILANHEPLLARLEPTELRLYRSEEEIVRFAQAEGYLQFAENRALVLVEEAIAPEQIDRPAFEAKLVGARASAERAEQDSEERRARCATSSATRRFSRSGSRRSGRDVSRTTAAELTSRASAPAGSRRMSSTASSPHSPAWASACCGSRVLEVQGRSSGQPRRTPVNLLEPRGRALPRRAARRDPVGAQPACERRGQAATWDTQRDRSPRWSSTTTRRSPVLRAYLKRWKAEVGVFFDGVGPDSSER